MMQKKYKTASVCIPPCYVKKAKEYVGDDVVIPAGSAFFFIRSTGGAGTITFAR